MGGRRGGGEKERGRNIRFERRALRDYSSFHHLRIDGGELFERVIDDDFVLTERSCAVFMRQVCEGIEFMHGQKILHLDLKVRRALNSRTSSRITFRISRPCIDICILCKCIVRIYVPVIIFLYNRLYKRIYSNSDLKFVKFYPHSVHTDDLSLYDFTRDSCVSLLQPENILCLTKEGNRIKIIDFGLAREYDPTKKLQVLFGTPEFVAPEVVNFDQIGFGTDVWSIGVICYVL